MSSVADISLVRRYGWPLTPIKPRLTKVRLSCEIRGRDTGRILTPYPTGVRLWRLHQWRKQLQVKAVCMVVLFASTTGDVTGTRVSRVVAAICVTQFHVPRLGTTSVL